jgi:pimeloyl-ACP methyl ester carboxylesterase
MVRLVLLPGMDGTGELFSEFVAALPGGFEAATVRYPTNRLASESELKRLVRAAAPTSGPYVLLAESYSTPLAIRYAASNPENLVGLILCAGFARSPVRGWRRTIGAMIAPIVFRVPSPIFAARRWLVGRNAPPALALTVQGAVSTVRPAVLIARLRQVFGCDVRAELAQIAVPILYIQAKQDRVVGTSCLEEIRRIQPQVAVVAVDGPHLLLQREPKRTAEIVAGFARRCI